jgi:hypothetical protein
LRRQARQVAVEVRDQIMLECWVGKIQHILYNVVAERILDQRERVVGNLLDQLQLWWWATATATESSSISVAKIPGLDEPLSKQQLEQQSTTYLLVLGGMINASLHHTTAMTVSGNFDAILSNSIVDKLIVTGRQSIEASLNHMVAIEILNEFDNTGLQCLDHELYLCRRGQALDHLLNGSCSMHVLGDQDEIRSYLLDDHQALLIIAMFEELLAKIVAKWICKAKPSQAKPSHNIAGYKAQCK